MSKIALVIGYGSIGKKHAKILKGLKEVDEVVVLTSQLKVPYRKINSLNDIKKLDPFYIIIASPTNKHHEQLRFLEQNFSGRKILVEKPATINLQQIKKVKDVINFLYFYKSFK